MDRIGRRVTEQLDDNPVLWKWSFVVSGGRVRKSTHR